MHSSAMFFFAAANRYFLGNGVFVVGNQKMTIADEGLLVFRQKTGIFSSAMTFFVGNHKKTIADKGLLVFRQKTCISSSAMTFFRGFGLYLGFRA